MTGGSMTGGQPSSTRLAIAASVACGLLVIVATRRAPHLSPDSMTYLSAAEHLRSGLALSDFTGEHASLEEAYLSMIEEEMACDS